MVRDFEASKSFASFSMIFPVLPVGLGIDVNSLIFCIVSFVFGSYDKKIPPLVRFLLLYYSAYLEYAHFLGLTFFPI